MKLHGLAKLCTNAIECLCDALMTRSIFMTELIFRVEVMSSRRRLGAICDANSTIFGRGVTLDAASENCQDNQGYA